MRKRSSETFLTSEVKSDISQLNPKSLFPDLHLTVITPLVRTNVNGIRVRDGLAMRRPMFEDELLDDSDWEEVVRKLDKFYTGKDGKAEMDRISLQFDLHNVCDGNEELKPMCSLFSYPIINSKSR